MQAARQTQPRRAPQPTIVPAEVQVARAFVAMTGIDPSSVFQHQSPPVRERPRSHGPARPAATARRRQGVRAAAARVWGKVRRGAKRVARWVGDLWARAKRALTHP